MLKQLKRKLFIGAAASTMVLGSVGASGMIVHAQSVPATPPAQTQEQAETGTQDNIQDPSYSGNIAVDQAQTDGMSEADEAAALQGQATIAAADAEAAALAANPGATVVKTELDNENGALVYSVELDNGLDVKVDAGNSAILHTEQAGNDGAEMDEAGETEGAEAAGADADQDNVQEESASQAGDATEAPGVEDAAGQ